MTTQYSPKKKKKKKLSFSKSRSKKFLKTEVSCVDVLQSVLWFLDGLVSQETLALVSILPQLAPWGQRLHLSGFTFLLKYLSQLQLFSLHFFLTTGFSGGWDSTSSTCKVSSPGSIPESGRSPGEGNSNPLQYFCLENSMDRGVWWVTVHGVAKSRTQLSN